MLTMPNVTYHWNDLQYYGFHQTAAYCLWCLSSGPVNLHTNQEIKGNEADLSLRPKWSSTYRSQVLIIHQILILRKAAHNPGQGVLVHHCIKFDDNLTILKFWQNCQNLSNWKFETTLPFQWTKEHQVAWESNANCGGDSTWNLKEFFIKKLLKICTNVNLEKSLHYIECHCVLHL